MVKGRRRRYELVYSNTPLFNRREYHVEVYITPSFERLVSAIYAEQARKRIKTNRTGTFYRYTPSKEYLRALNKFHSHKKQIIYETKRSTGQS